jgi:hypothetical protein
MSLWTGEGEETVLESEQKKKEHSMYQACIDDRDVIYPVYYPAGDVSQSHGSSRHRSRPHQPC